MAPPKRSSPAKAVPGRRSTPSGQETDTARLARERDEALEREKASAEVLRVISSSPGELKSVFGAILANAVRLCEASYGAMWLREGGDWRNGAFCGELPEVYTGQWRSGMVTQAGVDAPMDRIARSGKPVHVADLRADRSYLEGHPLLITAVDAGGIRTYLGVPMLKANELVGVIAVYRREVRPFTDKQIELLTNFAAQAVIAIENTRLLNELRQRTDDLSEALEQQTATSDVLQVLSSSPGELAPVFERMLSNATRICEAKFGTLYICESDGFRAAAIYNAPPAYAQARATVVHPHRDSSLWRAAKSRQIVQVEDVTELPGYIAGDPFLVTAVAYGGYRTVISVPMLKEDELMGVITIYRQEIRPFTNKQIELVKNFAAQAVIAIENTRLLNELRQSLEQQTATADVLRVISSSPGELGPVFNAMLDNATRICEAKFGQLFLYEDNAARAIAQLGVPPALAEFDEQRGTFQPAAGGTSAWSSAPNR